MTESIQSENQNWEQPGVWLADEVAAFYAEQFGKLAKTFGYTDAEKYLDWHSVASITEKLIDPTRFFRIIRNPEWEMIGYFESKTSESDGKNIETIQWALIEENYQNQGIGKKLVEEFFNSCREKNISTIKSFAMNSNIRSEEIHTKYGFKKVSESNDGMITYEKMLA